MILLFSMVFGQSEWCVKHPWVKHPCMFQSESQGKNLKLWKTKPIKFRSDNLTLIVPHLIQSSHGSHVNGGKVLQHIYTRFWYDSEAERSWTWISSLLQIWSLSCNSHGLAGQAQWTGEPGPLSVSLLVLQPTLQTWMQIIKIAFLNTNNCK